MGPPLRASPPYGGFIHAAAEYGTGTPTGRSLQAMETYYLAPETYGLPSGSSTPFYGTYVERRPRAYMEMEQLQYPVDARSHFRYLPEMRHPHYLPETQPAPQSAVPVARQPRETPSKPSSPSMEPTTAQHKETPAPVPNTTREEERPEDELPTTSNTQQIRRASRHSLHAILREDAVRSTPVPPPSPSTKEASEERVRLTNPVTARDDKDSDDRRNSEETRQTGPNGRPNSNLWKLVDAATDL
jgi:hypothetical protein